MDIGKQRRVIEVAPLEAPEDVPFDPEPPPAKPAEVEPAPAPEKEPV